MYTLYAPNGQTLPGGTIIKNADVNVYTGSPSGNLTEYVADYYDYTALIGSGSGGGNVATYTSSSGLSQCGAPASSGIPTALPILQTYSFCMSSTSTAGGSGYQLGVSGTFSVYATPITTGLTNKVRSPSLP